LNGLRSIIGALLGHGPWCLSRQRYGHSPGLEIETVETHRFQI
jgi:hypothetical protein